MPAQPTYGTKSDAVLLVGEEKLEELTNKNASPADINNDTITINDSELNSFLLFAESIVDSNLSRRYDVDVLKTNTIPKILTVATVKIAVYLMSQKNGSTSEDETEDYEEALNWIEKIGHGEKELPSVDDNLSDMEGFASKSDMVFEDMPFTDFLYTVG